jgi:hypothetical protein
MTIWQRWKQTSLHNKALVFSGIIVAFGTLFYSGAAIVQVWMFNRSSKQVERQTERLITAANTQARAAKEMTAAVKEQAKSAGEFAQSANNINEQTALAVKNFGRMAKASEDNIKATQQSFRDDQRAWVGLENFSLTAFEPGKITITATAINSGKTPALAMFSSNKMTVLPVRLSAPEPIMLPLEWSSGPTLPPQGRYQLTLPAPSAISVEYQNIKDGRKFFYLLGEFKYDDIYGKGRSTTFCVTLSDPETKQLVFCNFFNGMD